MERRGFVKLLTFAVIAPRSLFSQPPDRRAIILEATVSPPLAQQQSMFTLIKPTGAKQNLTAVTDQNGFASVTFKLKPSDKSGTYRGQVSVQYGSDLISDATSVTR